MYATVFREKIALRKRPPALIAAVRPLSHVHETMVFQTTRPMCGKLAPLALALAVLAGGAEVLLDMFILTILFHTHGVALDQWRRAH